MSVVYVCRLIQERTPSGKVRLKYGYFGHMRPPIATVITGPAVVAPPDREMTEAELHEWMVSYYAEESGFSVFHGLVEPGAPLVEAVRVLAGEVPAGAMKHSFFWGDLPDGLQTFCVTVANEWTGAVPDFGAVSIVNNESTPQPPNAPPGSLLTSSSETPLHAIDGLHGGALVPGGRVRLMLHPMMLRRLRSQVASLSPESHWISLQSKGREFARIPGGEIATFLEQLDH